MTLFHVLVTSIALRAQAIPLATNYYIFQRLLVNFKSLARLDKAQKGLDKARHSPNKFLFRGHTILFLRIKLALWGPLIKARSSSL